MALAAIGAPAAAVVQSPAPLAIEGAWARPSPMVERAGAAYMVIHNGGTADDALVGGSTPAATAVELHETTQDAAGMMAMSRVEAIPVPAGGRAVLEPGGYHVMLIDLVTPLEPGTTIELTLSFASGATLVVPVEVRADAGMPMGSPVPMPSGMTAALAIEGAWARPSPMVERAGAAYMVIHNGGTADDALVGGSTSVAASVELHETAQDAAGMMTMSRVETIVVPAGGEAVLAPGGYHLMLIELVAPLEPGTTFELTLTFASGVTVTQPVEVRAEGAMPMGSPVPMPSGM